MPVFIHNPKGGGWIRTLMDIPTTVKGVRRTLRYDEALAYIRRTGATKKAIAEYIREYKRSRGV